MSFRIYGGSHGPRSFVEVRKWVPIAAELSNLVGAFHDKCIEPILFRRVLLHIKKFLKQVATYFCKQIFLLFCQPTHASPQTLTSHRLLLRVVGWLCLSNADRCLLPLLLHRFRAQRHTEQQVALLQLLQQALRQTRGEDFFFSFRFLCYKTEIGICQQFDYYIIAAVALLQLLQQALRQTRGERRETFFFFFCDWYEKNSRFCFVTCKKKIQLFFCEVFLTKHAVTFFSTFLQMNKMFYYLYAIVIGIQVFLYITSLAATAVESPQADTW